MAAPHVGPSGSSGDQEPSPQGPSAPVGLIWRLRGRSSFQELARRGTRRRGRHLAVTWLDDGGHPPRVGYAIGRRFGGAVERNRMRRRLRSVVAELAAEGRVPPGAWLIGAQPGAERRSGAELREELADLLSTMHEGSKR